MESRAATERTELGAISASITREIVRIHARLYGHGPTKAKTHVAEEFIVCVLEDIFMPAEKTLIAAGNLQQVEATRGAFQKAVEDEFVTAVQTTTGRTVRGFFSEVHVPSETAIEFFLLENGRSPSRDGAGPDGSAPSLDGAGPDGSAPSLDGSGPDGSGPTD